MLKTEFMKIFNIVIGMLIFSAAKIEMILLLNLLRPYTKHFTSSRAYKYKNSSFIVLVSVGQVNN